MLIQVNTRTAAGLFLGLFLPACSGFKEGYDKSFKASYVQSYTNTCTSGAVQKGSTEPHARKLCGCMAQYLVDHRSSGDLTQLSMSPNSKEMQQLTQEAATDCVARGFDDNFKANFEQSFTKSCTDGAVKQGAEAARAQPICSCMGTYLTEHRAPGDLVRMSADPQSPQLQAAVKEAGASCQSP